MGVLNDVLKLIIKVLAIIAVIMLLFTFLFGTAKVETNSMNPSIQGGDRIIYYRLDKNYVASNCAAYTYGGRTEVLRVVAVAGDTVEVNENGLYINGALQSEPDKSKDTLPVADGPTYPVKLGEGEVFLLGDNRTESVDSRTFGPVQAKKTKGELMTLIRSVEKG